MNGESNDVVMQELQKQTALLQSLISQKQKGGSTVLVTDYAEQWLNAKQVEVKINTWDKYKGWYQNYIKPFFANQMLTDVTKVKVQSFVKELTLNLSARTIQDIKGSFLVPLFDEAVDDDLIEKNPVKRVKTPRVHTPNASEKAFTDAELIALETKGIVQWRHRIAHWIGLYTGVRREELLPLRLDDIDLNHNTIYIHRALISTDSNHCLMTDYNKTKESTRIIPICQPLREHLIKYMDWMKKENRTILIGQRDKDGYTQPDNFNREFRKVLARAGIKRKGIGYHSYRRTFVTICKQRQVGDSFIASVTGHKDTRMIARYTDIHRASNMQMNVVTSVADYMTNNARMAV